LTDQQINAYTGDGLRAWKQNSSGARTYFLYDGSEPVCEMNGSGNLTAVNDFGADGVWARHTTTSDWFYTFDPQGCLSQKIGRDGSVLCSSIYDAQGHEATTDTHPDPFSSKAWTGQMCSARGRRQAAAQTPRPANACSSSAATTAAQAGSSPVT